MHQFDLTKALDKWRKSLNKYQGFESGNVEELVSHVSDAIDDLVSSGMSEEDAFNKVTNEKIGDLEKLSNEFYKAQSITSSPTPRIGPSLATNFIKVAFRNMTKSRPHSYINLAGLVIGFVSVILISIYVISEFSFDKFHQDHRNIYRVVNKIQRGTTTLNYTMGPPALGPALKNNYPEIEEVTRVRYSDTQLLQVEDNTFYETSVLYADSSFFKIFDFEFLSGNKVTALNQPNAIVITERIAEKYFGTTDALNKIMLLEGSRPLTITGVLKNVPRNSHIYFEMLISFQTFQVADGYLEGLSSWAWMGFINYIRVHPSTNLSALEEKISNEYKTNQPRFIDMNLQIYLQQLSTIYLGSTDLSNNNQVFRVNSYTTLYSLMAVGILIILIASFNYVNLSIAIGMNRFKEIAVRRVLGSSRGKLVFQFVLESIIYTVLSLLIALVIAYAIQTILPDNLVSKQGFTVWRMSFFILLLLVFAVSIGLASGVFPALRLTSVHSLELLKGTFKISGGGFRNVLIGFQFMLSATLICASLIIGKQIRFLSQKELGFKEDGIVAVNIGSDQFAGKIKVLQNILESKPGVRSVCQSNHIMGEGLSGSPLWLKEKQPEDAIQMAYFQTDYNFVQTMGLELVEGRFFSPEFPRDSIESIVLNETAVKTLGLKDPIGRKVVFTGGTEREIIGVLKDFHFLSLHQQISSMAVIMPFTYVENFILNLEGNNIYRTLGTLETAWKDAYPGLPFDVRFLDSHLQSLYEKDKMFSAIIQFFSILATAIACLGLYSLGAISLTSKLKQISIRRVLGAPVSNIILLNAKGFLLLVLTASIAAWPLVWYVMNLWLSLFAYHIELNAWYFVATILITFIITLLTLSYHLFKSVTINPAKILRDN